MYQKVFRIIREQREDVIKEKLRGCDEKLRKRFESRTSRKRKRKDGKEDAGQQFVIHEFGDVSSTEV